MLTSLGFWLSYLMPNHVIIVAAGAGRRFGARKQFYPVQGRPLFVYATEAFQAHAEIDAIILVVPRAHVKRIGKLLKNTSFSKVAHVVAGGKRRQDSVAKGLSLIRDKRGIVVIHDAVRPLISKTLISRGIKLCQTHKSAIPGIRVRDTVKKVEGQRAVRTIPRHDLYLVQTPQFYDLQTLRKAVASVDFRIEYTDEAAMLESLGTPVYIFRGDPQNIKVTDKADLKLVRSILA